MKVWAITTLQVFTIPSMHQNGVQWAYKPSMTIVQPSQHLQTCRGIAYCLQSLRKPYCCCLPSIVTVYSFDYHLPSIAVSCTLKVQFRNIFPSYYHLMITNNFLLYKLKILHTFLPFFVEKHIITFKNVTTHYASLNYATFLIFQQNKLTQST